MEHRTVKALGGYTASGAPVHEDLHVDAHHDASNAEHLVLSASPVIVLGVAAGDAIRVTEEGGVEVIERGRNVSLHLYGNDEAADEFAASLKSFGARIDGRRTGVLSVVTVPVEIGFGKLESALEDWAKRHPTSEWYYGNVYADDGETPLNWW